MHARLGRSLAAALVLSAAPGLTAAPPQVAPETAAPRRPSPVIYSAEVDSIIHPVSAEYMIESIDRADRDGAALIVFTLRTPGGLVDSTRAIVSRMIAAKTPVAVFVGPSGSRAASAGFLLTIAADVNAMAPGTHIGAAHPVAGSGEKMDAEVSKKAAEDLAAYARTLASQRHRNETLSAAAVTESRAFTEREALTASPPLVDLEASNLAELLARLDGRTITRFDGSQLTLKTAELPIVRLDMSVRQRVLGAVAHPNIAYLLLSLGTLGLTIELWSPGAVLPGVVGGLCLLLAFFALQVLPVNYVGLLLILFGLLLFALEIKITSYGLLTIGGLASLIFGSMMLMNASAPELRVSLSVVLPVVFGFTGIGMFLVRLALKARRQPAATGAEGMLGEPGLASTPLGPHQTGQVLVHGEIWQARASEPIAAGARVQVTGVDGLTLTVQNC